MKQTCFGVLFLLLLLFCLCGFVFLCLLGFFWGGGFVGVFWGFFWGGLGGGFGVVFFVCVGVGGGLFLFVVVLFFLVVVFWGVGILGWGSLGESI